MDTRKWAQTEGQGVTMRWLLLLMWTRRLELPGTHFVPFCHCSDPHMAFRVTTIVLHEEETLVGNLSFCQQRLVGL